MKKQEKGKEGRSGSVPYRPETVASYIQYLKKEEHQASNGTKQKIRRAKSALNEALRKHGIHNDKLVPVPASCHALLGNIVHQRK